MLGSKGLSVDCDSDDSDVLPPAPAQEVEVPFIVRLGVVFVLVYGVAGAPSLTSVAAGFCVLCMGYALYLLGLTLAEGSMVYPVHLLPDVLQDTPPEGVESQWVEVAGERSEAWYFRSARAGQCGLVVIFHGNGECIDQVVHVGRWYSQQGVGALLVEYQGYGRSCGSPSQKALVAGAAAHIRHCVQRQEVDARRVVFHGRSLGGGVACQVALEYRPAALILESTFSSVASIAASHGIPTRLAHACLKNPFDSLSALKVLRGAGDLPTLVAHGTLDDLVPFHHAETLAKEAGVDVYARENGHDLPFDGQYTSHLAGFLRRTVQEPLVSEGRG